MNLANCPKLKSVPVNGVWYRAIQPQFMATPLHTRHTRTFPSRFSAGRHAITPFNARHQTAAQFRMLYLSENPMLALFEVQALLGSPMTPGGVVPNPLHPWTILNVTVKLDAVADLTDPVSQGGPPTGIEITAQELTGDWRGYHVRSPLTSVTGPAGVAPTQEPGYELYDLGQFEGFLTVSARLPEHDEPGDFS